MELTDGVCLNLGGFGETNFFVGRSRKQSLVGEVDGEHNPIAAVNVDIMALVLSGDIYTLFYLFDG